MESAAPVSRYIHQTSKKRVFPGGSSSSSSAAYKDVEVLELSPPTNFASAKYRSSKDKEVLYPEIIDVDMEEDDDVVMLTDEVPKNSAKGKEILQDFSVGNGSLANDESPVTGGSHDSFNADDFSSSLFYGEDEWADSYYDDILYDDYSVLESQFDHMDVPTGVEMPFPWFPDNTKVQETSFPTHPSVTPLPVAGNSSSFPTHPSFTPLSVESESSLLLDHAQKRNLTTSRSSSNRGIQIHTDNLDKKGKPSSKVKGFNVGHKKIAGSSNPSSLSSQVSKALSAPKSANSFGKNKRNYRSMNSIYSSHFNHSPSGAVSTNGGGGYSTLNIPTILPGADSFIPSWQDLPFNMLEPAFASPGFLKNGALGSGVDHVNNQLGASSAGTSLPTIAEPRNVDEIKLKYDSFKRFETVEDFSDHHYCKNGYSAKQPPKAWAKKIQEEWRILEKDLPDKIYVRVYETRMDLLRAVIIGAEGTPYHDGLYFFDVFFPSSYPNVPPHVHYHSGGLRINPNLYNCGKVCLSLLNTWSGSQKEKWIPGVSTMLQVLVSIQGLILNAKPYFNEPGYADMIGSVSGEKRSLSYNESTFMYSLQTMVYNMRRPPKHFEDFVLGHFCKYARDILVSCKAYMDGAQVGCLVKGGVQDVDEGDKSCSQQFRANLAGYISVLVNTFSQIGAKDCKEFLALAQNGNGVASAHHRSGAFKSH